MRAVDEVQYVVPLEQGVRLAVLLWEDEETIGGKTHDA